MLKWLMATIRVYPVLLKGFYIYFWQNIFAKQDLENMNRLKRGFVWDMGQHILYAFTGFLLIPWEILRWVWKVCRAVFSILIILLCIFLAVLAPLWFAVFSPIAGWQVIKGETTLIDNLSKAADEL